VPMSRNIGALTLLDPSGPAWPVMGVFFIFVIVMYLIGNSFRGAVRKKICYLCAHVT
jgi:hypothetical protein